MKILETKKPDRKKMNTFFFITELYLLSISLITVAYGYGHIAIYLLWLSIFFTLFHCIMYRFRVEVPDGL